MYLMTARNIEDVANEISAATHELCSLLHAQQCKIVDGALHPAVKVEAVLQLQQMLERTARGGDRQRRMLDID